MIKTDTAFILGAGASMPFGFPSGAGLREMICLRMRNGADLNLVLQNCGIRLQDILAFRAQFEQSGLNSIDAFIARRQEFQVIGELAIAVALLPLERTESLYQVGNKAGNSDWYPPSTPRHATSFWIC